MAIVEAKHFTFTYAGAVEPTLNNVSFAIERGEVIGMIGPMGAGKTTLCMAIAGFVPRILGGQATGTLQVAGHDWREASRDKRHRQVGMVFDYEGQLTQLRVLDEVMMPLLHGGASAQEAEEQARRLLARVGLGEALEGRKVWELSGGQQQRLAIAAMLALDPQVLIFDDAMNMLDPRGQEEVRGLIADLAGTKTLVVVEQDPELMQTVDRILVLIKGNVVAQGTPDEILRNHDMLARADLEPPAYLRVARALDLSESPRTPEELALALGQIDSQADAWPEAGDHFGAVLVHLEDVTYCYPDGVRALDNVHLHIRTGEVHAVIGNSGAGKTTLANHLAGLLKPTAGKVVVCGSETRERRVAELALTVGTVLQNPDEQISEGTVWEEISFPLRQRQYERTGLFSKRQRYPNDYIQDRVSSACELVGIEPELLECDPILLPRGQRKLVTIAAALVMDPQVLVLDEPIISLGAAARRQIIHMLARLRDLGKAVLLAENNVDFVSEVANTVTVLDQGGIVLQGAIHHVFAKANWEQLAALSLPPPCVAQLAQRLGVTALTCDELVTRLVRQR